MLKKISRALKFFIEELLATLFEIAGINPPLFIIIFLSILYIICIPIAEIACAINFINGAPVKESQFGCMWLFIVVAYYLGMKLLLTNINVKKEKMVLELL